MQKIILLFSCIFCFSSLLPAQNNPVAWDNTVDKKWGKEFQVILVRSSADTTLQKCWFRVSLKASPQPLIVSLHSWSGDYNQEDPLAKEVLLRDWNYIHPDFRGPNNNPKAGGSPLVINDLEDAIRYAIQHGNVDTNNVHIIGVSGGGYATLLAYMQLNFPVKSFNAWASISDLESWYWESKGRGLKYAGDVRNIATINGQMNFEELKKRSPLYLPYPSTKRKDAALRIYAGIHDGYTGSVPVSHSINFYNKIASERYAGNKEILVPDSQAMSVIIKRIVPDPGLSLVVGGRKVHLQKKMDDLSLTIFEGGHEMLVPQGLTLAEVDANRKMEPLSILTIGDSNGAFEFGWPNQLMKLMPYSTIINKSISGNTIGFDNLDQEKLNTLKNVDRYLDEAYQSFDSAQSLDFILIGLGTNDTKAIFKERQKEVPGNLAELVSKISAYHETHSKKLPAICIITPSPIDEHQADVSKYGGGDERIRKNNRQFKKVAKKNHVDILDSYTTLKEGFNKKTTDGIHLNEKAQFELATIIVTYINQITK